MEREADSDVMPFLKMTEAEGWNDSDRVTCLLSFVILRGVAESLTIHTQMCIDIKNGDE
jgi:hypothetical protein